MKNTRWFMSVMSVMMALYLPSCQQAPQNPPGLTDADKQQISAHREALVKAVREGNASAFAAQFTEDAIYLPPEGEMVRGRVAIEKLFQGMSNGQQTDYSVVPVEVSGLDGLAYEVGTFTIKWTQPGSTETHTFTGKHIWILRKQADGSWKDTADISNLNQPPPTTQQPTSAPSGSKKKVD